MKFVARYTIKWHNTDVNRRVTPMHLLMYMEETSNAHLVSAGMSFDELRDQKGLAFLVSRINVLMHAPLYVDDEIDVETWVCESRGLSFVRCYRVLKQETVVAEAYSVWALMDLKTGNLLPASAFPYEIEPDEPLGRELSARLRVPPIAQMDLVGKRRIVYSDIDYNGHMNNTHYPNMLCDFTPDIERTRVVGYTLSFLREAAYKQTLDIYRCGGEDGTHFFRAVNEAGEVCLEAMLKTEGATLEQPAKNGGMV